MATRLTNDIREGIARAALRHRFTEQVDALIADRAAFADAIYSDLYRKVDRDRIEALPAGWLPETSNIGVQFGSAGGRYERLPFDGSVYGKLGTLRTKSDRDYLRRVLSKHSLGCIKVYDDRHKLSLRFQELDERRKALEAEYETAKRQTEAALASVNTIKRLVEVWPEVEAFAKPFDEGPRNLPSIPVSKLNELLALPVAA